ncbi:sensor histidine kinase [Cryptosporangium sp. NPDC048952]|uniref:sensor histidine kinase n=1 Tax=Cryptosporangium sp. NPDC048952 TaxID=3363961 RepID=UPI00371110D2
MATIDAMVGATARAVAYLAGSLFVGVAGLAWTLVSVLGVTLVSLTHLGGPTFLAAAWVTRRFAGFERRRARWVVGSPIDPPYVPISGATIGQRVSAVAAQPATWRDVAWLAGLFPLGLAGGVTALVVVVVDVGAITAPLWAWAVPNPHAPFPADPLMTTVAGRFGMSGLGLTLFPLVAWVLPTVGRLYGRAARALLGPGAHRQLVEEATRLAETRRRVVDAQASELRRIERDLHDGAQARIVAAGMTLALAARKLRSGPAGAAADVELARHQLDEALTELRRLVRGIHPPILTDRGLHAAIAALAGDSPLPVTVLGSEADRYPAAVESAAYFVAAEGLANASKHAGSTQCSVSLYRVGDTAHVLVTDDGHGGADPAGSGIDGLRRRVEALDGTLELTSPPGGPTVLHAELPCAL